MGTCRIGSVYDQLALHPIDKEAIGREFNTSPFLRFFLDFFKKLGFTTAPKLYFKHRFKKLIPSLNDYHLAKKLNVQGEELAYIKENMAAYQKLWFGNAKVENKIERLHQLFILEHSELSAMFFDKDKLNQVDFQLFKKIEIFAQKIPLILIDKILEKKIPTLSEIAKLEEVSKWIELKWIDIEKPPENILHKYQFLKSRHTIFNDEPWSKSYFSKEGLQEIVYGEELSLKSLAELEGALKLIDFAEQFKGERSFFYQLIRICLEEHACDALDDKRLLLLINWSNAGLLQPFYPYEDFREWALLLIEVRNAYDEQGVENFIKKFNLHPLSKDTTRTYQEKRQFIEKEIKGAKDVDSLFESQSMKKMGCLLSISHFQIETNKLGGEELFVFLSQQMKPEALTGSSPLTEDPSYPSIVAKIDEIRELKVVLLVSQKEEERFRKAIANASKVGLGSDSITTFFLGKEYELLLSLHAKQKSESLAQLPLEQRLKKLIPYSRNLNESSFFIQLFIKKTAHRIVLSQQYELSDDLDEFINRLSEILKITSLPVKNIKEIEALVEYSLNTILSGRIKPELLLDIIKHSEPETLNEAFFSRLASQLELFYEENKIFLKDPIYFESFQTRFIVRSIRALLFTLLPDLKVKMETSFKIIEDKFSFNEPYSIMQNHFAKRHPAHFFLYFLGLLKSKGLQEIIENDPLSIKAVLKQSLVNTSRLVHKEGYAAAFKIIEQDRSDHFPMVLFIPYLRKWFEGIEKIGLVQISDTPRILNLFLENIPSLILGLEILQGIKKTGAFLLIPNALPFVITLSSPFFSDKEKKALIKIIGVILPEIVKNHDLSSIITYFRFIDSRIQASKNRSKEPLNPTLLNQNKTEIALQTFKIIDFFIDQIHSYHALTSKLFQELEKELL